MRFLLKALLGLALLCFLLAVVGLCRFYFYSGDIPNFAGLDSFAPAHTTTTAYDCAATTITVIPYTLLGQNVERATRAAEGDGHLLSRRIPLQMFCNYKNQTSSLSRQILELKASTQIQRRFTSEQILAIYLNRAYFGDGVFGIENASQHYYAKSSSELDVAQAAMLAGMLPHPSVYSPTTHPDKARERRDAIISTMVSRGAITPAEGQAAIQTAIR